LKFRSKIFILILLLFVSTLFLIPTADQCCLCTSFRYHAPCLIDLKTGKLTELDLYFPHDRLVAELAEPQPEMGFFSFVNLGNVTGTKDSGIKRAELHIPVEILLFPKLCIKCRTQLPFFHTGRYVLSDLYSREEKTLIPLAGEASFSVRCYDISIHTNLKKGGFAILIQGTI